MNEKKRISLTYVTVSSAAVCVVSLLVSLVWRPGAVGLLLGLFIFGCAAGWVAQRHGWFCGIIVGLPLALMQMTRQALSDFSSLAQLLAQPDYWYVMVPACLVSTGMAIMGGVVGAWLQDMKWQREK